MKAEHGFHFSLSSGIFFKTKFKETGFVISEYHKQTSISFQTNKNEIFVVNEESCTHKDLYFHYYKAKVVQHLYCQNLADETVLLKYDEAPFHLSCKLNVFYWTDSIQQQLHMRLLHMHVTGEAYFGIQDFYLFETDRHSNFCSIYGVIKQLSCHISASSSN